MSSRKNRGGRLLGLARTVVTVSSRFRLGFILRIPITDQHAHGSNVPTLYRDALDLAIAADALGFDALGRTQHHFGAVDCSLHRRWCFSAPSRRASAPSESARR